MSETTTEAGAGVAAPSEPPQTPIAKAVAKAMAEESRENSRRLAEAEATYTRLMLADAATDDETAVLLDAARLLGKSHADVLADYRAIEEARSLTASLEACAGCKPVAVKLVQWEMAHREIARRQIKRIEQQQRDLVSASDEAHDRVRSYERNRTALAELVSKFKVLCFDPCPGCRAVSRRDDRPTPADRGRSRRRN